ncbi:hypothetical protein ABB37_08001 [Leptomonas pyrrhocoris]|uniref:WW domain-containing protein n=1 Tax=Leptomonas pyrrhocoris TaxID=157538 RepID=A0A0M9FUG5_LEPPY|nr:hypothetical protein ABB37_08001 [Leptomonas pyrrhocoris]XP_015654703.1 hypothetical protein ABB37_08001 [Leptomonas pyrrhocoris]KPA76263.1 hypothetical protein ABB37_08001 [Leptomonas pyrrhocoris]KPA76264.1 hypothetical protein ABB37_08001 [Leptomonas pyrrhocoris]|eukprot:XP_015654702.1 hypothetical protein ABB37_08001 [Leptomonas pyrrhocoris]
MAVSLPNLQDARAASLTLPNPSMPSVDIAVQFAAITDAHEFERVMLRHDKPASANRSFSRGLRRSFSSPVSSYQDFISSEVSLPLSDAHGVALQAPPHAIVLLFNPFSTCSFSKLRVEWVHVVRFLRQQRQQLMHSTTQHEQSQKLSTAAAFHGAAMPSSPLLPGYPAESVESFPVVLLVATRMELMGDAMEAMPSIHVPSLLDVTEVAQALQAQAYVEVGTNWDESIDLLRATIARACMGELANAPLVTYNAAYGARQASVARAIEAVQMDPYGEEEEGEGVAAAAAAATVGVGVPLTNAAPSASVREAKASSSMAAHGNGDAGAAPTPDAANSEKDVEEAEEEERTPTRPRNMGEEHHTGEDVDKKEQRRRLKGADSSFNSASASASASVLTAAGTTEPDERRERVASEMNTSDVGTRSADPSSFVEQEEKEENACGEGVGAKLPSSTVRESIAPEASMPGRRLRRDLATSLALLVAPDAEKAGADRGGEPQQGKRELSSPPSPPPLLSQLNQPQAAPTTTTTATAAAAATDVASSTPEEVEGRKAREHHRRTRGASSSSKWTWRRHPLTSRIFYVHRASGKSQYDFPDDYDGPPLVTAVAAASNADAAMPQRTMEERGANELKGGAHHEEEEQEEKEEDSPAGTGAEEKQVNEGDEGAATPPGVEMESMREDLDRWHQRQQLQLRRTQVARLERQVHQLRRQSVRLHAQSEANAELKQKVATLRSELDDTEQAFSAGVAEQNQKLATEVLHTTVAVEELTALLLSKGGGDEARAGTGSAEQHAVAYGDGGGGNGGAQATLTGVAKDIQQLDADMTQNMESLRLALSRRDAEADALELLRRRRERVAHRKREAEAEITALLQQSVEIEEALLPLHDDLDAVQDEVRLLQDRVRLLEEEQRVQEQQRQRRLGAYVAQKRATEELVRQLDQLRHARSGALEAYEASRRYVRLSSRVRPAEVLEENTRLRLGLESSTGRCAEALLRNAEAVHALTLLAGEVAAAEERIVAQQTDQRRRLVWAGEEAEAHRAAAVQLRYNAQESIRLNDDAVTLSRYSDDSRSSSSYHDHHYQGTPTELLDVAVEACAEALEQWKLFDRRVAAPLLEGAQSVEAELLLLLRGVSGALHRGTNDVNLPPPIGRNGREPPLCHAWLQSKIVDIRRDAEGRCRAPLSAFMQHISALRKAFEVDPNVEGAGPAPASPAVAAADRTDTKPSHSLRAAHSSSAPLSTAQASEHALALERGLWSTCDCLVSRLPRLDDSFVSAYRAMRKAC